MKSAKLAVLLSLALSCLSVTEDFYDKDVCSPGTCISCSYLNNDKYTGLSCTSCYKKQLIFSDKGNDPKFGTRCGSDLGNNCLVALPATQELADHIEVGSEGRSKAFIEIISSNLAVVKTRFGSRHPTAARLEQILEGFKTGSADAKKLLSSNDSQCLLCENGYFVKNGVCTLPLKRVPYCIDFNPDDETCIACDTGYWIVANGDQTKTTSCQQIPSNLVVKGCMYQLPYAKGEKPACDLCSSGYVPGDQHGYTCIINRDLSRYIVDNKGQVLGCNFFYNVFSIGIRDWDNSQQICSYSSAVKEPFFSQMLIVVSVIVVLILIIFISIIKTEKAKPVIVNATGDYIKQDSFSGLHDQSPIYQDLPQTSCQFC